MYDRIVMKYMFLFPSVAFRLYDLDRDDKISRDELLQVRLGASPGGTGYL